MELDPHNPQEPPMPEYVMLKAILTDVMKRHRLLRFTLRKMGAITVTPQKANKLTKSLEEYLQALPEGAKVNLRGTANNNKVTVRVTTHNGAIEITA